MNIEDIKKLAPELQPLAMELAGIRGAVDRIEEKIISVMHNQIALNQTIKGYEAKLDEEISKPANSLQ